MNTKGQKIIAVASCFAVVLVMAFSLTFVTSEANHHCSDNNCPVCNIVQNVEHAIKQMGSGSVSGFDMVAVPAIILLSLLNIFRNTFSPETPISNKVRLNN